jgi:catechol 2,3-dioxygenase-like lactoylglutathione lyase family enzyme
MSEAASRNAAGGGQVASPMSRYATLARGISRNAHGDPHARTRTSSSRQRTRKVGVIPAISGHVGGDLTRVQRRPSRHSSGATTVDVGELLSDPPGSRFGGTIEYLTNGGCEVAVETRGIRHVHLMVGDQHRSVRFYREVFGMEVGFRDGNIVFLHSPSRRDDPALHLAVSDSEKARVGDQGGCQHFGITVKDRSQLDASRSLEYCRGPLQSLSSGVDRVITGTRHRADSPLRVTRQTRPARCATALRGRSDHQAAWETTHAGARLDEPRTCRRRGGRALAR